MTFVVVWRDTNKDWLTEKFNHLKTQRSQRRRENRFPSSSLCHWTIQITLQVFFFSLHLPAGSASGVQAWGAAEVTEGGSGRLALVSVNRGRGEGRGLGTVGWVTEKSCYTWLLLPPPPWPPPLLPVSFMALCLAERCTMGGRGIHLLCLHIVSKTRRHTTTHKCSKHCSRALCMISSQGSSVNNTIRFYRSALFHCSNIFMNLVLAGFWHWFH